MKQYNTKTISQMNPGDAVRVTVEFIREFVEKAPDTEYKDHPNGPQWGIVPVSWTPEMVHEDERKSRSCSAHKGHHNYVKFALQQFMPNWCNNLYYFHVTLCEKCNMYSVKALKIRDLHPPSPSVRLRKAEITYGFGCEDGILK